MQRSQNSTHRPPLYVSRHDTPVLHKACLPQQTVQQRLAYRFKWTQTVGYLLPHHNIPFLHNLDRPISTMSLPLSQQVPSLAMASGCSHSPCSPSPPVLAPCRLMMVFVRPKNPQTHPKHPTHPCHHLAIHSTMASARASCEMKRGSAKKWRCLTHLHHWNSKNKNHST